jgi:hypothetical protein
MSIVQIGIYIFSVVVFLNWFRRAYGNLHRLAVRDLQHTETMSVWCWFIPIIGFFRPVQIMKEIWKKTQQKIQSINTSYEIKHGGLAIGLWWTLHIFSTILSRLVFKAGLKAQTIEQLIAYSQANMLVDLLQLVEALFVIFIVDRLSKMESKLDEELKNAQFIQDLKKNE